MLGRFVGYRKMRCVLYSSTKGKCLQFNPEWLISHTHAHTLPLDKVSVPRATARLVDLWLPAPRLSIGLRLDPGNLGQRTASRGQCLAAGLSGVGGFREGNVLRTSGLLDPPAPLHSRLAAKTTDPRHFRVYTRQTTSLPAPVTRLTSYSAWGEDSSIRLLISRSHLHLNCRQDQTLSDALINTWLVTHIQ